MSAISTASRISALAISTRRCSRTTLQRLEKRGIMRSSLLIWDALAPSPTVGRSLPALSPHYRCNLDESRYCLRWSPWSDRWFERCVRQGYFALERSCVGRNAEEKDNINLTLSGEWRARSPYVEIMLNELVAASKFHLGVNGVLTPVEMLPSPSAPAAEAPAAPAGEKLLACACVAA